MPRVLIVDSVDDNVTRQRHEIMSSSPRLKGYEIDYCYAFDITLTKDDADFLPFEVLLTERLTADDLYKKIHNKIEGGKFDFVLVHTGFVFREYPEIYFSVFKKLRAQYPKVGFGFEERYGVTLDKEAFDDNEEVRSLQDLFFRRVFGR